MQPFYINVLKSKYAPEYIAEEITYPYADECKAVSELADKIDDWNLKQSEYHATVKIDGEKLTYLDLWDDALREVAERNSEREDWEAERQSLRSLELAGRI